MTQSNEPTEDHSELFSEELKRECCLMIAMGCDRETACSYLGKTAGELRAALHSDLNFRRQLLRAEATPEFHHMRNLYLAAKDEKHWRASVWWLERRAPERYARRAPESLTAAQLQQVIEELAETIVGEVDDLQNRQRLLARLLQIADKLRGEAFDPIDADSPKPMPSERLAFDQQPEDEM